MKRKYVILSTNIVIIKPGPLWIVIALRILLDWAVFREKKGRITYLKFKIKTKNYSQKPTACYTTLKLILLRQIICAGYVKTL